MSQLTWRSIVITTWFLGCSTTSLMDATDDMGASSAGDPGTTDSACSACFESSCAWEVTECASDPKCAEWLTCARDAPDDGSGSIDSSWFDSCPDASGTTAAGLQDALTACLTSNPCCEGTPGLGGNAGASPGAGGNTDAPDGGEVGEASAGGAGGTGGTGVGGAGDDAGTAAWQCTGEECHCEDCLFALKHGEIPEQAECMESVQACVQDASCVQFFRDYVYCNEEFEYVDADPRALEGCLYRKATSELAQQGGFEQFMRTVYPCATGFCSNHCVLEQARSCLQCQKKRCSAELEAYLSDSNAVLYKWCRSYCHTHPDDATCSQECGPYGQAAAEVLQVFGQCVQESCDEAC